MPPGWIIDEHQYAGEEHLAPEEVARFDHKMPFDPTDQVELLREFGLTKSNTVIDFGSGTGEFALANAEYCDRVVAVDISEPMLAQLRQKNPNQEGGMIEPVHAGFLSYKHAGELASFAFSKDALHHLPDFWKIEALQTIGGFAETRWHIASS